MEKIKSVDLLKFKEQLEHFMIYEIECNGDSHESDDYYVCGNTCEDACKNVLYRVNSLINEIYEKENMSNE